MTLKVIRSNQTEEEKKTRGRMDEYVRVDIFLIRTATIDPFDLQIRVQSINGSK